MRTMSQKVEANRTRPALRSAILDPWEGMARGALTVARQLSPARWLVELLVIALAGTVIGLGALCGLAVLSTAVPTPRSTAADHLVRWNHEAESGAGRVWGDSWFREAR